MKLLIKTLLASAVLFSATASANDMYIDLGADYAVSPPNVADADFKTGIFNEFGFSQLLATSVYDLTDNSIFGNFYDTNIVSELTAVGVPTSGIAMDGITPVDLVLPNTNGAVGQTDIDALSPLVPPLASDSEGFLLTWDLQVEYHFDGILSATGPDYTGGTFKVFFNDFNNNANDRVVVTGDLMKSKLQVANLLLYFDITYAEAGWLFVDDGSGTFFDASTRNTKLVLDTNVNPPIPTANQLLVVGTNAIRQTTLDGSITAKIPEPSVLALMGLGLLGFGAARRRRKS